MTTPLQQAAQAVIDHCYEYNPHELPALHLELRKALEAELAHVPETNFGNIVEPYGWLAHGLFRIETGKYAEDNARSDARRMGYGAYAFPLYLHPPQPQATTPALRECWYESNELKVCRKCGQMHDKAIAAQGEKP